MLQPAQIKQRRPANLITVVCFFYVLLSRKGKVEVREAEGGRLQSRHVMATIITVLIFNGKS